MLQTALSKIQDGDIHQVVTDFCRMLRWGESEYLEYPLFNFLELVMSQDPKFISLDYLAVPLVLDKQMGQLRDHGIYPVCRELKNGDVPELDGSSSLLSFLKEHFAYVRPKKEKSHVQTEQDREIRTILQRRKNGTL